MKSVFQVAASMILAHSTVAFAANTKAAVQNIKQGAAATTKDAKAKAGEVVKGAKSQAQDIKAKTEQSIKDETKKTESSQSSAPAANQTTEAAEELKNTAKEAKAAMKAQGGNAGLPGTRKSLIIPESTVLPEKVLRLRAVYAGAESKKGYDGAGNKVDSGLQVNVSAVTTAIEYGITNRLAAQFVVPYRLSGKAKVSSDTDFASTGVKELLKTKVKEIKNGLGVAYTSNATAPVSIDLAPGISIPKGAPIKTYLDGVEQQLMNSPQLPAALVNYAKAQVEDQTFTKGMGDIEIGAKYSLATVDEPFVDGLPLYASVAAGIRLNSSKYSESTKKGEKPVGRGTTDVAARLNADYEVISGVQLQIENQTEVMAAKGKAWNFSEASKGQELDLERKGMRQLGYSKLVVAPGTWIPHAEFLLLNARYNWNNESTVKLGDEETVGSVGRSAQLGLSLDGLKMKLPVQLDYDYVIAARGRSVDNAFDAHVATLKLYYKF
jgi:hypothetical protein